tara:strand:+ start:331 stop:1008 length:678 start_codon:yes stop_codon:yes gene_type:complete
MRVQTEGIFSMKSVSFGVAAVVVSLAVPAAAQDVATMGGPRIEVRAGYDNVSLDVDYDDGVDSYNESDGTDGIAYGGEIGYDYNYGSGSIGAYAGVDFASTDICSEFYGADELCLKAGRNFTVGGRLGYMIGSDALFYGKAGYSNGRIRLTYEDFENILGDFDEGENLDGFHVGAGAEVQLSGSSYAKLEYVYTQYNAFDYSDTDVDVDVDLNRHQVLLGLGVRF